MKIIATLNNSTELINTAVERSQFLIKQGKKYPEVGNTLVITIDEHFKLICENVGWDAPPELDLMKEAELFCVLLAEDGSIETERGSWIRYRDLVHICKELKTSAAIWRGKIESYLYQYNHLGE